ncbi:hypothetical protein [Lactobacillus johnsonii]|uniref:hypothetical protein n=1 Tax=Lactobacillus johnsonii TaxID=33959 RepID=UPI000BA30678|nr:hypothetical protein [Lactobacillus johnsonii]PAB41453.1 hypothetical protein A3P60_09140 [Lactobacillus johnsonii]
MDKEIKKNFLFAFLAQAISLIVSCATNLILPKAMSVADFSYWQLFIFYSSYIPCLALGLNDGVYLRYGGKELEKLDYIEVKSQYYVGIFFQLILGILTGIILTIFSKTAERRLVIIFVIIYYLFFTLQNYLGYIFQAVNETNIYSKSIIIQRIIFFVFQISLLIFIIRSAFVYIPFYILGVAGAFVYLRVKINPQFHSVTVNWQLGVAESLTSMKIGISLMIANICSMLVLGIGRQIIDMRWGLIAFGKVSFSLTLMNFALTFIMQIGLVLFPALRRLKQNDLKNKYKRFNIRIFYILPLMYLAYIPVQFILKLWLPQYAQSINYLSVVLPICYFDSKMDLIGSTFFKVLNKQVTLLRVNLITIAVSAILCGLTAYVFNNMNALILSLVVAIAFRSILADYVLSHFIGIRITMLDFLDIIMAVLFIEVNYYCNVWIAFLLLLFTYVLRVIWMKISNYEMDLGKI